MVVLNYPGSKRRLLDFIYDSTNSLLDKKKYVFDIFCGTGCVAEMYQNKGYKVIANDVEKYAYNISTALLNTHKKINKEEFNKYYFENYKKLLKAYNKEIEKEKKFIDTENEKIIEFNASLQKIWREKVDINGVVINDIDDLNKKASKVPFCLMTLYYSGVYFGLEQSIELDSIRYAIENMNDKALLFTALYTVMKEASFSKDGHMAQPLSQEKNLKRMFKVRRIAIKELFDAKLDELLLCDNKKEDSITLCDNFERILDDKNIMKKVSLIYADPPYTDMQYSRYFHLLNTITDYSYPEMTKKNGALTTGLYPNNRYQSLLSNHGSAFEKLTLLMKKSSENDISLCFSYAYPVDTKKQATDRYTVSIDDLISEMKKYYKHVEVNKENFEHCNNRNSEHKRVFEYLIIGSNK